MMRRRRACLRVVRASWNEEKRLTFRGNVLDKFDSHHLSYYHVAGVKKRGFARADKRYARIYCVCARIRILWMHSFRLSWGRCQRRLDVSMILMMMGR
mgnify:CR=1 FL=1